MSHKVYNSALEAMHDLCEDGLAVMLGGFGLCGIAENLIAPGVELEEVKAKTKASIIY